MPPPRPPLRDVPELRSTVGRADGRTVVAISGGLDLATAPSFEQTMRAEMAQGPVVLDLRELAFMDSSGLRAFNTLLRDAGREGWTFAIRSELQSPVREVLEMTGMIGVLPMEPAGPPPGRP